VRPLEGITVVELRGRAPVDFAALMLADLGARVLCVEPTPRAGSTVPAQGGFMFAGRERLALNLKDAQGLDVLRRLVAKADVVVEGCRPGTAERLGVGPADLQAVKPDLVYGRVSGYGQTGPLARRGGHDLNYVALGGPLGMFGRDPQEPPAPPVNLLGDFAGGAQSCVVGVLAALVRRASTGQGAVVDAAMSEGVSYLSSFLYHLRTQGSARSPIAWTEERGSNVLNGAAPFYDVYRTAEGAEVSFAAIEPEFFAAMVEGLALDDSWRARQNDRASWPELRRAVQDAVGSHTREELDERLAGHDACYAPVLSFDEVASHEQHVERRAFRQVAGHVVPAPAPVIDGREAPSPDLVDAPGDSTIAVLTQFLGLDSEQVTELLAQGAAWSSVDKEQR
jgi:alpha-methylacyl-CoA racemase